MNEERTGVEGAAALVAGGAGFVGSNLVLRLLADGAERVHVVDNFLSSNPDNVPNDPRVSVTEGSVNDPSVLDEVGTDWDLVFHLVTFHGNQSSIADPEADLEHNLRPSLSLARHFAGSDRLQSLVYASAGCTVAEKTYGDARPTREDDPISLYLDSPYQISKIVGEFYLNYFERSAGLPSVKARFQNVYGPREMLGAGRWRGTPATVWRNVAPTFVYRALRGLPLHLDNEGRNSRDFIYVEDLADGLVRCATHGEVGGVYNLASGRETTIRELAEATIRISGSSSDLELGPPRDWDRSGRRFGSTEKAEAELGFVAGTDLEEGLAQTIAWTRENLDRVEASMARHDDRMATVG